MMDVSKEVIKEAILVNNEMIISDLDKLILEEELRGSMEKCVIYKVLRDNYVYNYKRVEKEI